MILDSIVTLRFCVCNMLAHIDRLSNYHFLNRRR